MKTKTPSLTAALCAAFSLLTSGMMQAAVCTVPGTHGSINAAANDPACTTINVAAGLYPENIVVTHSCDINGAQAGQPFAGRVSGGPLESTVIGVNPNPVFNIVASDVTIDGFTVKNPIFASQPATGIQVSAAGNDAAIMNNIIDMITSSTSLAAGVSLSGGPDNVNVQDNEIKNVQSPPARGVFIAAFSDPSQNVQVKGNFIHDITGSGGEGYGVSIGGSTSNSGLKILNNTISNITGLSARAIALEADTPGVVVTDNDITNLVNTLSDAVAVGFANNPGFATAEVHANNFNLPATQYGILVTFPTSGSVNGTCNWWNSPSGPTTPSNPGGTGAQVGSNVTYQPWLIAPAPGGLCAGGNVPTTAAQCKNGGWMTSVRADGSTFKNQGDCLQYVNKGK
jgi:hypothetical protein